MRFNVFIVAAAGGVIASGVNGGGGCKTPLIGGVSPGGEVSDLEVFDFGAGPRAVVAGSFDNPLRGLAKFENGELIRIGNGVGNGLQPAWVNDLCTHEGGLAIGGRFDNPGFGADLRIGPHWQHLHVGFVVHTVASYDGALWTSNSIAGVPGQVRRWEKWENGVETNEAAPQLEGGNVEAALSVDLGDGPVFVIGGRFTSSEGAPLEHLAYLTPEGTWAEFLGGANRSVKDLLVRDEPGGRRLYLAGLFDSIGGISTGGVAVWDGETLIGLGDVRNHNGQPGAAHAIAFFDDGSGEALYVGGRFDRVNGVAASNLARLRNGTWEAIGAGVTATPALYAPDVGVNALAAVDDGLERALFVGGYFTHLDGVQAHYLARIVACSVAACPGDTNGDNVVDFQDLNAVVSSFNTVSSDPGYNAAADIDGDGDVDFADLNVVVSSFNLTC